MSDVGFGPFVSARFRLITCDTAKRKMAGLSPICKFNFLAAHAARLSLFGRKCLRGIAAGIAVVQKNRSEDKEPKDHVRD